MKSSLKFALVIVSFAFLTACGGGASTEATTTDSVATAPATETAAPVETPVADSTATVDTTKKAQ